MATEYLFSNNATTTLAQSVSATATVLNVASGDGDKFPSPASGQAFAVTLVDAATGLTNEICYCTSRSGDQLTVVRGREGTNAIAWSAGDTCANYITADVMENWLQESDLNGYATQSWSDGRYVRFTDDAVNWPVQYIGINKSSAAPWFKSGPNYTFLQPAGDYATNTALTAETNRATRAESNLQSSKVNKTGDTMTGTLYQTLGTNPAVVATGMSGPATSGETPWTPQFISKSSSDGGLQASFCARDRVGYYPYMSWQFTEQDGTTWHELQFRSDNRLYTASGNVFALTSDLSNYVPTSTYVSDFSTSDSRVINLPYGHRIQAFTTGAVQNGDVVTFPQAFSGVPSAILCQSSIGDWDVWAKGGSWTNTSFTIQGATQNGGPQSMTVIAIGPK